MKCSLIYFVHGEAESKACVSQEKRSFPIKKYASQVLQIR